MFFVWLFLDFWFYFEKWINKGIIDCSDSECLFDLAGWREHSLIYNTQTGLAASSGRAA